MLLNCCASPTTPAGSRMVPGDKCPSGRSWQMGEGRIEDSCGCWHKFPIPWLPLPTTHPTPHAERKYKKQAAALALGLAGCGPAKALSFPFHRHRGCSGCFCFPLATQESRQCDRDRPSLGEQGSWGHGCLPQESGPWAACLKQCCLALCMLF